MWLLYLLEELWLQAVPELEELWLQAELNHPYIFWLSTTSEEIHKISKFKYVNQNMWNKKIETNHL